ncbi:ABC transporter transmembrane domain-containing protein [Streptomyces sp. NPDC002215]|uniref:ABC transporter transmembrane domain-containing protein n=1 Tax=Streptomyces sp. NPDC002215 TaxID=3154412 RepID=UPI0033186BD8
MMETSDISINSPGASLVAARRPSLDAATSKRLTVGKSGITSRRQADETRGERVGVRKSDDDPDPWRTTIHPGTVRRVLAYFRPHIRMVALFVVVATMEALIVGATPLLLRELVDNGIVKNDRGVVILTACRAVGLAVLGEGLSLVSAYISGRIGQVVSYDLRVQALDHVRRLPLAFFTRTQTGVLVGRLHTELIMAQQQFSGLLMAATSAVKVVVVLAELFYLSWLVGVITLALVPIFIVPWVHVGRVIQRRTQRQMDENAGLGGRLQERFNVQGAMLSKLFGRPDEEMAEYADRANGIRKIGVNLAVWGRMAFVMMTLMASPLPLSHRGGGVTGVSGASADRSRARESDAGCPARREFSRAGWNPHRRTPAWGGCPWSPPRSTTRRPGASWPR